jgi:two-component system sensor histidine kinase QseC
MQLHRPHSLQGRLILSLVISLVVTLGSTGLLSYFITQHEADEIFNARLATSARVFDVLVARKVATATLNHPIVLELPKELELTTNSEMTPSGHRYENKIAFQVWNEDGQLLVRSASAPEQPFAQLAAGYSESTREGRHWHVFTLASGPTWVQVAEHDDIREEMANELSFSLITPLLAGALLLLVFSYGTVRVGLRSLAQLAMDIRGRGPESLSAIELAEAPREVATVASAMNQLLTRLRHSREREIRFTDAAAHELKTPLAALRVHADNLRKSETPEQQKQSLSQLLKSLDRAQRLSEQLLALSAVQAESRREPVSEIAIAEWIADVLGEHVPAMEKKHQTFEATGLDELDAVSLKGQPLKLHRLLSNLLDNAIRHGDADSLIRLDVSASADTLKLEVSNTGEPIPPAMLASILEPYVRVLGTKAEGTGLGLAIVKEIIDQHDGQLQVRSDAGTRQTTFTVSLRACARS